MRFFLFSACLFLFSAASFAQSAHPATSDAGATAHSGATVRPGQAPPDAVPLSQKDSSSRSLIIDLSPPLGDLQKHPDSEAALEAGGVSEMHLWDPHRAAKDDEVGNYYLKQQNYRGARWRFEDALRFKPNDAEATFRLAQIYEKTGPPAKAADYYRQYLSILPYGPYAKDSHAALDKLGAARK